jgi:hypothetical protein
MLKKCATMLLTLILILAMAVPAYAISPEEINGIVHDYRDGSYITTVNAAGLDKIREKHDSKDSTYSLSYDKANVEIMTVLGYDIDQINNMGEEEIEFLLGDAASVRTVSTYFHYDDHEGTVEKITLEEFDAGKSAVSTFSGNDGSNSEVSSDGYFKIITTASYRYPNTVGDEKGWYTFSGTFVFYGRMPTYRMTDAASLYVDDVQWSQTSSDYRSTMTYTYYDDYSDEELVTSTKTTQDRHLFTTGLYYTWDLPTEDVNGHQYRTVTSIEIYVRGVGRMRYYNLEQAFNLCARYEHTYATLALEPSFSWTLGEYPGVSLNTSVVIKSNTYHSLCQVDYDPGIYLV